jgi:hypothetical protein
MSLVGRNHAKPISTGYSYSMHLNIKDLIIFSVLSAE